eukprot:8662656-Lingulodinium_polyedra.AAC.1
MASSGGFSDRRERLKTEIFRMLDKDLDGHVESKDCARWQSTQASRVLKKSGTKSTWSSVTNWATARKS